MKSIYTFLLFASVLVLTGCNNNSQPEKRLVDKGLAPMPVDSSQNAYVPVKVVPKKQLADKGLAPMPGSSPQKVYTPVKVVPSANIPDEKK